MRKLYLTILLLAVAAATVGAFAGGAQAGTKVLAGTFTHSQIEKSCSNAGGVPTNNDATGGYGCYAKGGEGGMYQRRQVHRQMRLVRRTSDCARRKRHSPRRSFGKHAED